MSKKEFTREESIRIQRTLDKAPLKILLHVLLWHIVNRHKARLFYQYILDGSSAERAHEIVSN